MSISAKYDTLRTDNHIKIIAKYETITTWEHGGCTRLDYLVTYVKADTRDFEFYGMFTQSNRYSAWFDFESKLFLEESEHEAVHAFDKVQNSLC